jgi:hypothetical protein
LISEQELHEAIAECQGQRNPNASTCMKLASFYTILDHIKTVKDDENDYVKAGNDYVDSYSFAPPQTYDSGTEFSDRILNMDIYDVLTVMDELMTTLSVVNPRLYDAVMRKL